MNYLSNIYQKDSNIVFRKIANEYILVPVRQKVADLNSIYILNEIGAMIWELIDGRKSLTEILANVMAGYDVETETAKDDLLYFVGQLVKIKAVEEINA